MIRIERFTCAQNNPSQACYIYIEILSGTITNIPLFNCFEIDCINASSTFPFIILVTDLTVRLYKDKIARKIIIGAFIPAFFISLYFADLRIAIASVSAYALGQFLDILVFSKSIDSKTVLLYPTKPAVESLTGIPVISLT